MPELRRAEAPCDTELNLNSFRDVRAARLPALRNVGPLDSQHPSDDGSHQLTTIPIRRPGDQLIPGASLRTDHTCNQMQLSSGSANLFRIWGVSEARFPPNLGPPERLSLSPSRDLAPHRATPPHHAAHGLAMPTTFLTRTTRCGLARTHDLSGVLSAGIEKALRRSGPSTLTWWREHDDDTHLARVTVMSATQCLVEVLVEGDLRQVRHTGHSADDLISLPAPARRLVPVGVVHRGALLALDDAAFVLDDWLTDGRLAGCWRIV